ncbi:MAG: hypothetical protein ACREBG_00615 [Pyrinomonadaceae bacterium]
MDRLASIDDILNKAFLLAYFIHGNKETAVRIVSRAMSKLDVAATAQGKRFYYRPSGRSLLRQPRSIGLRSKVTFNDLHLLQRLVYIESEVYEKQKEQAGSGEALGKEDMIIHFIKHLVRITLKRNSFYVTLGMSRLLYNYTTQETMGIYNLVVQDPERVKDDYYYRSRKGVLMQEIKERFGDLVKICHGQRGEERLQAEPDPDRFADLVRECLSFFTPWATPCLVPAGFDPISDGIPPLQFEGRDKEDQIEVNRIHAALHPNCYQRLIKALGFSSPDQRLEVPHFFLSNESGNGGEGRRTPTVELGREDLNAIKNDLDQLAERRKKASAGLLQVVVDGVEYARLDLRRARRVRFNMDGWRELIEIWTTGKTGDLLLASHLLTSLEEGEAQPRKSSIVLEGGQKLSIDLSPSGDASGRVVDISYRETNPIKAASLAFQQLLADSAVDRLLFAGRRLFEGTGSRVLIPVSVFILLLVFTAGLVTYLQSGKNRLDSPAVTNGGETPPSPAGQGAISEKASGTSSTPIPFSSPQRGESIGEQPGAQSSRSAQPPPGQEPGSPDREKRSLPNADRDLRRTSVERSSTAPETMPSGEEVTRAVTRAETRLSLRDVKSVFVEVVENEQSNQILREVLIKKLQASNRFTLSKSRDDADAVLKVRTTELEPGASNPGQSATSVFRVQLINAQGQVIWPLKGRSLNRTYSAPTAEQVGVQILQDVLADIRQQRRRL